MKLLRTTALTAALMTAAVPMLTESCSCLGLGLARRRMGLGRSGTGACGRSVNR